jgi:hypothetical protein
VIPEHVVVTDAHLTALQALDAADVRAVNLSCCEIINLGDLVGGTNFAADKLDDLKAAISAGAWSPKHALV